MTDIQVFDGLEGVYVTKTKLCSIDGQKGELVYSGYDIYELAESSTFEETAFLLWNQRLPSATELADLDRLLKSERELSQLNSRIMRDIVDHVRPMRALEICVTALGAIDPNSSDLGGEQLRKTSARLTARMATVIAAFPPASQRTRSLSPHVMTSAMRRISFGCSRARSQLRRRLASSMSRSSFTLNTR